MTHAPVEITTRYATTVESLPAAWAFVMERIDSVGPDPSITISPVWTVSMDETFEDAPRHFSVVIDGMVPEVTDSTGEAS